jgi:small subunit ribosomal protein S20
MPNIKSAKKRVITTEKKTLKNKMFRSELKTTVKKFDTAAASGDKAAAATAYTEAVKKVDQASARGTIHKNAAARKKSQFTKKLNSLNK